MNSKHPMRLFFIFLFLSGKAVAGDACVTAPRSPLIVNVRDKGATGNGSVDDTHAIQSAINQVSGTGGTVLVPNGTYLIDAVVGVVVKSDMTLRMADGSILKAKPNDSTNYAVIQIIGGSDINVIGGTLVGERDEHLGTTGEWGMGMLLRGAANVVVEGVTAKNGWGDGFYVAGSSKNIVFCSVVADNNRRQGMSIVSANGIVIKNSTFKNTAGVVPQAGIDFEPNENDIISNVRVTGSTFVDNKGWGVQFYTSGVDSRRIENITIEGNSISRNESGGIVIFNTSGHKATGNVISNNRGDGILLTKGAKNNSISGNKLSGKNGIRDVGGNKISDNSQD